MAAALPVLFVVGVVLGTVGLAGLLQAR